MLSNPSPRLAAWTRWNAARNAYRNGKLDDATYLAERALWEADQRAFDAERGETA